LNELPASSHRTRAPLKQGGAQRGQEAARQIRAGPDTDVVAARNAPVLEQRPQGLCSGEGGFVEDGCLRVRHTDRIIERLFDVKT